MKFAVGFGHVKDRKERTIGLSWQQGPLSPGRVGRFLVSDPLPDRLLYAEPLRRRMRVRFDGAWTANSEHVVLLHEPGRYLVASRWTAVADAPLLVREAVDGEILPELPVGEAVPAELALPIMSL